MPLNDLDLVLKPAVPAVVNSNTTVDWGWLPNVSWPQPATTTWTYVSIPDHAVHSLPGKVGPGCCAPCGASIATTGKTWGLTGARASTDLDQVTCLACLRAMVRAK